MKFLPLCPWLKNTHKVILFSHSIFTDASLRFILFTCIVHKTQDQSQSRTVKDKMTVEVVMAVRAHPSNIPFNLCNYRIRFGNGFDCALMMLKSFKINAAKSVWDTRSACLPLWAKSLWTEKFKSGQVLGDISTFSYSAVLNAEISGAAKWWCSVLLWHKIIYGETTRFG